MSSVISFQFFTSNIDIVTVNFRLFQIYKYLNPIINKTDLKSNADSLGFI